MAGRKDNVVVAVIGDLIESSVLNCRKCQEWI